MSVEDSDSNATGDELDGAAAPEVEEEPAAPAITAPLAAIVDAPPVEPSAPAGPEPEVASPSLPRPVDTSSSLYVGPGQRPWALIIAIATILVLGVVAVFLRPKPVPPIKTALVATAADLIPVHTRVYVGGDAVRELRRLATNDVVHTDKGGRARLRLDNGTSIILDGETKLSLTDTGFKLEAGRVFVTGAAAKTVIDLGSASADVVGSAVGIERRELTKVYVASGEITARAAGREVIVKTGETADLSKGLEVGPERGFDDWTGGLAAPWAASRRAVAEVWGRGQPGQAGSPLTIRTQEVRATVHGEIAETKVATTFFNAGESSVLGDYRMAIPRGAIVSGFSVTRNEQKKTGRIALAKRGAFLRFEESFAATGESLEWAGEGWLRGSVPSIAPGASVTVAVSYVEWLPVRVKDSGHVLQYRYPLAGEGAPPLVGEFFISVDAGPAGATQVAAGMGAHVSGTSVELRKSDFRPSADFVVDMEVPAELSAARAYVSTEDREDEEATVVFRTEVPRLTAAGEEGVTLAVVLDTSASVDPALFDAGRAFVEALTKSLGDTDRLVVLAADTTARPVGPAGIRAADAAHKEAVIAALGGLGRGGATDLGRALEAAADAIPRDASSGMVVYVGDGWGSVGDRTAEAIRARLARREAGVPRIGAVLVGPSGNRRTFAELTRGSGPLVEIGDSEDAARASVELLESAIVPTITGISLDLGPDVSRVYPREDVAAPQGSSLLVVGKLASDPPKTIKVSYRSGGKVITEERRLAVTDAPISADVRRRWADARAQAMALAGRGRESVTEAALGVSLLTPWTAWTTASSGPGEYVSSPLSTRVLQLGSTGAGYDVEVGGNEAPALSLASPEDALIEAGSSRLEDALYLSAIRSIDEAKGQLKACRDSRAALRPDLPGAVQIELDLDGDGRVSNVVINNSGDATLATCLKTVLENLRYPRVGEEITVHAAHTIVWPPVETLRGKKCSPTSTLAVPLRRGVWRERIDQMSPSGAFLEARRGCELSSWTAKRSFLELALVVLAERGSASLPAIALAKELEDSGDAEAAGFLRKEALRRSNPLELRQVRRALLSTERLPWGQYVARYEAAKSDRDRLDVVKTFLGLAPHDPRLRSRLMTLLATLGEKEALVEEARRLRADPFVEATLVADAAHLLRTVGLEDDAKRTYGEIAERATHDPWAHALLGDRLRSEGWFDDASAVYAALEDLVPLDAASQIRLALAHYGANRVDVALRILDRVARTGGRSSEVELAMLAEHAANVILRSVLGRSDLADADRRRLERALAEMNALPAGTPIVVEAPAGFDPVSVFIERGPADARELVRPRALATKIGLVALHLEPADPGAVTEVFVSLARSKALAPVEPYRVKLHAIVGGKLVSTEVELPASGERIEVDLKEGAFGAPRVAKPNAPPAPAPAPAPRRR